MTKTQTQAHAAPGQLALSLTTPLLSPAVQAARPDRETRLAAAHAVLARGIAGIQTDPAALAAFLTFRSKFHDYSLNNCILIWMQRPTARHCAGLRTWAKHGRKVRKGERGITILAPVLRRPTATESAAGTDSDEPVVVGYRTVSVFCYEQTDPVRADALVYSPPVPRLGADAPEGLVARLEAVASTLGYAVVYTHRGSYADGWINTAERTITVRAELRGADRAAVLTHELAHAVAHTDLSATTRAQREVQAEGAAFVCLAALGLDTARASLPYVRSWAGDDDAVTRELAAVDRIGRDLLARIETAA